MRTKLFSCGLLVGACLVNYAFADNCTGYDTIVTTSSETRDLGNGMKLTTFQAESALLSQDSVYNLVVGQCSGTSLSTPNRKLKPEATVRPRQGRRYGRASPGRTRLAQKRAPGKPLVEPASLRKLATILAGLGHHG